MADPTPTKRNLANFTKRLEKLHGQPLEPGWYRVYNTFQLLPLKPTDLPENTPDPRVNEANLQQNIQNYKDNQKTRDLNNAISKWTVQQQILKNNNAVFAHENLVRVDWVKGFKNPQVVEEQGFYNQGGPFSTSNPSPAMIPDPDHEILISAVRVKDVNDAAMRQAITNARATRFGTSKPLGMSGQGFKGYWLAGNQCQNFCDGVVKDAQKATKGLKAKSGHIKDVKKKFSNEPVGNETKTCSGSKKKKKAKQAPPPKSSMTVKAELYKPPAAGAQ